MLLKHRDGRTLDIEIREAAGADFDGVRDCMQSVFKGIYLNPAVFEKGYLERRTESEKYRLFAAVTSGNKVAAHMALNDHPWFINCREICMLAVRPEYRGFGLGQELIGFLTQLSHALGSDMTFATVATHLSASQEGMEKNALVPCGFWITELDRTKQAATFNNMACKLTAAVYVKPVKIELHSIFVPPVLAPLAQKIYQNLNLPVQIMTEPAPLKSSSQIVFYPNEYHHTCYIFADICGTSFRDDVEEILRNFEGLPYTFILHLNIGNSTSLQGYSLLRAMGFGFAGFFPGTNGKDYCVMCLRGKERFDPQELKLSAAARALLDEIILVHEGDYCE